MSQFDSNELLSLWRNGIALSEAWFEFSDEHGKQVYKDANGHQGQRANQIMMVVDLWAQLGAGELLALGHRVSPNVSDGPVFLPIHFFLDRPSLVVGDSDDLEISGWKFERVRICSAVPSLDRNSERDVPATPVKRGGGRRDTYRKSAVVLRKLYENEANRDLSAEKLRPAFAAEFERQFPREHYRINPPSERTLRDQIERFRQELAETGENDFAG